MLDRLIRESSYGAEVHIKEGAEVRSGFKTSKSIIPMTMSQAQIYGIVPW